MLSKLLEVNFVSRDLSRYRIYPEFLHRFYSAHSCQSGESKKKRVYSVVLCGDDRRVFCRTDQPDTLGEFYDLYPTDHIHNKSGLDVG
jgi:hypothetical protein